MNQDIYLPLHQKKTWDEANRSIQYLLEKYESKITHIRAYARETAALLSGIFPVLSELCDNTCPFCPDTCCLSAKIWFDLKDLLFLHLNKFKIPDFQPLGGPDDTCRYLGPGGCRLHRRERPFICTWYLCPPQISLLRKNQETENAFSTNIQLIKTRRKQIEEEFIKITAG